MSEHRFTPRADGVYAPSDALRILHEHRSGLITQLVESTTTFVTAIESDDQAAIDRAERIVRLNLDLVAQNAAMQAEERADREYEAAQAAREAAESLGRSSTRAAWSAGWAAWAVVIASAVQVVVALLR